MKKEPDPKASLDASTSADSSDIETDFVERKSIWSRRRFITLGASLTAGLVASFWSPLSRRLGSIISEQRLKYLRNPYYQLSKIPALFSSVTLREGFYARESKFAAPRKLGTQIGGKERTVVNTINRGGASPKTIIHYVDSQQRIPFVAGINEKKLRLAQAAELFFPTDNLHVAFARASAMFELAALQQISAKQYENACQLLVAGIRHDLAFKSKIRGAPSLRLYDLLAKLSVRRNQKQYLDTLLAVGSQTMNLIDNQSVGFPAKRARNRDRQPAKVADPRKKRQDAFKKRLLNWQDKKWQAQQTDLNKKVEWSFTVPPDTTWNLNRKLTVDL